MKRYIHYVTIPLTGSMRFSIESDDPAPSTKDLLAAAEEIPWQLQLSPDSDDRADLGEEFSLHEHLNRGNVCHAVCAEMELEETEDTGR